MSLPHPARLAIGTVSALGAAAALAACNPQNAPRGGTTPEPAASAATASPDTVATAAEPGATITPAATAFPATFRALGTEPFWAVHIGEGTLRYMTPQDQDGTVVPFTRKPAADDEVAIDAVLNGKDLHLSGRIAECSDGMSDRIYPFTITIKLGDEELKGCARPSEG